MLSVAKIIQRVWQMNDRVWRIAKHWDLDQRRVIMITTYLVKYKLHRNQTRFKYKL